MENNVYDYLIKAVFVGNTNTGKTSALLALQNQYVDTLSQQSTIGVEFGTILKQINNKKIKFCIWDTAGQEKFNAITHSFYRGTSIVVIFFDLSNIQSYRKTIDWINDANKYAPATRTIILVGNKLDLQNRCVSYREAYEFASRHNIMYEEISVTKKINLENILYIPTLHILKNIHHTLPTGVRENNFVEVKTSSSKLCGNCTIS